MIALGKQYPGAIPMLVLMPFPVELVSNPSLLTRSLTKRSFRRSLDAHCHEVWYATIWPLATPKPLPATLASAIALPLGFFNLTNELLSSPHRYHVR